MSKIPAVAYCRVSTKHDDQENSFEAQQKIFLTQADKLGYKLMTEYGEKGIYADQGISGKSRKKRDNFNQMIEDAKNEEFQFILTTSLARYARDVVTLQDTVRELRRHKVYIHFLKENIKTNDFTEEVLMNILSVLAQNFLVDLSKTIQVGMRQAQRDGKWTSQPPFGYDRIKAFLVINENESKGVQKIFEKYINGMSLNKIAQYLNDNDFKTKKWLKKGSKWDGTSIRNVLKNPIYYGKQINHQYETTDIFNDVQEKIDKEDLIFHQKDELKIIDKEIFDKAQEILKERSSMYDKGKRYSTVNILSNLFYCGNCGSTMKRFERTANHKPFYMCRKYHNSKTCNYSNYAREDKTIEYIKDEIKNFEFAWEIPDLVDSEGYAPLGFESIKEMYEQYILDNLDDDLIDDLPSINEKITKLENRKNNLIDMRSDGEITKEEYLQRRKLVEDELEPLLKEKKKIDNLVQEREKVWKIYEEFCTNIKEFDTENMSNIELRKIINKISIKTVGEGREFIIDWNSGLDKGFDRIIEEYVDNKMIDIYGDHYGEDR
jgi:DNA invertase Pin-like site-specific DNA recombinase